MGRRPLLRALPVDGVISGVHQKGRRCIARAQSKNIPIGSPMGARRPPLPLFSSSWFSSLVVGMCSLLFDILIVCDVYEFFLSIRKLIWRGAVIEVVVCRM